MSKRLVDGLVLLGSMTLGTYLVIQNHPAIALVPLAVGIAFGFGQDGRPFRGSPS